MKVIQELYDTITEMLGYEEEKWDLFKSSLNTSLKRQFFELFQKNYSGPEIAHKLFRSETAIAPYRNTKHAIKEALEAEIFNFKPPQYHYSPFQRAYYHAVQQQAILKILVGLGRNHSVSHLGNGLLRKAIRYHFTEIILDVSKHLCTYHSSKDIDSKSAIKYACIWEKYNPIYQKESQAELAYSQISSLAKEGFEAQASAIQIAKTYLTKNPLPKTKLDSFRFYLFHYLISIYVHEIRGEYTPVGKIANEAYRHFCAQEYDHKLAKGIFIRKYIFSLLRLDDLSAAFQAIEIALDLSTDGNASWFITLELKLRTCLKSGDFNNAHQTYQTMIDHRNFEHQPLNKRVRWILLGTYVQFLRVVGLARVDRPTTQFINWHFNFLKENKTEIKDLKVPNSITHLLFAIYNRDYDSIESMIYTLKDFCNTYLKKSTPNYRSSCFIKMLLLIPQNNFHPKVVERRVGHYMKKLEAEAFIIDHTRIIEVIPYEKLWSIILDHLQSPKRKRRSGFSKEDWSLGKRRLL